MKSIFKKIEIEVENLGESIEHMELDTDDFATIYIKIEPSARIDDDFYLVGQGSSITDSLQDILTTDNDNGIESLKNKLEEVYEEFIQFSKDQEDMKQWLESQI